MRLIDLDELEIGRCDSDVFLLGNRVYAAGWNGVIGLLESAPTVDAIIPVRCEDCAHWGKRYYDEKGFVVCPQSGMRVHYGAYCSYGEAKSDTQPQRED